MDKILEKVGKRENARLGREKMSMAESMKISGIIDQ